MPEVPAQEILSLAKNSTGNQTERMATPEELYALKRIAEVESALAELARAENSSRADVAVASETPVQIALPEPEHSAIAIAETAAAIHTGTSIQNPSANKFSGELNLSEQKLATAEPGEAALPSEQTGNPDIATQAQENSGGMVGSWMLEFAAILDQHRIWVESGGEAGTKADLCGANLENADLTGVNLQGAFLQRANLRGADLSMANLRHASLVQADLCNANLLGAELRGANRMGATLYGAEGLWLGRLGGANLYDAMLPETISSIDGSKAVWERINAFYLIAPIFIVVLFVRFQFLLLRVWSSMAALPAVFPDGQTVEQGGPWYLMGLVRRHFRWLRETKTPVSWLENAIATLLAYWAVPATIAIFWMRYLVRQDMRGTSLHVLFFVLSVSVATGLPSLVSRVIRSGEVRRTTPRTVARMAFLTLRAPIAFGLALLLLSFGVILGIPADSDASRKYFSASPRRWAAEAFRLVGYRPYADLIEATLVPPRVRGASAPSSNVLIPNGSSASPNANANDAPGEGVGAKLNENSLRYARGYRAVLSGARLWRADLVGAYLTEADLRNANMREAHLRDAVLDHARADHVLLISADGTNANLTGADLRGSDMTYAIFENASFAGAKLGGASLYGSNLKHTNWLRADLTRSDMRDTQMQEAGLSLANLELTDFSGAKLGGAQFGGAQFKGTILLGADLRNTDMRGAAFPGAVLRDAPIDGSQLGGADFRGALGLTAAQVCSARGWSTAQFDPDVLLAVQTQCGTVH